MMNYKLNGTKVERVQREIIRNTVETINDIILPVRNTMSTQYHYAMSSIMTKEKYDTTFAVDAVIVRVAKSETTGELYIYGIPYKTTMDNSPYVKAIVEHVGDFDKKDTPEVQIQHWDKKTKSLVNDYKITCNKRNENGKIKIHTNALCVVNYSMIESDLNKIFKWNKELVSINKRKLINKIINVGLNVKDNKIYAAGKNITGKHYQVISWSPSSERNETALFTSLDQSVAFNILDSVSGGTLSNALCKERKIKELIKFSKRLGQLSSPSIPMGEFANEKYACMIYMAETMGPEDYTPEGIEALDKIGVKIDRNTSDGAVVYSCEFVQDFIISLGKKVSLAQANLMAIQTRCSVLFSKVFGEAKSKFNIKFRAERYKAMVPKDRILEVPAGTDVSKLNKADYDLIVVGNPNNIGIIMDINGGKTLKDISLQQIVDGHYMNYLLDVAKCSETETSGQMLQKFMAVDKNKTISILKKKMLQQFGSSLDKFLTGDVNVKECSLAHFLLRHCPDAITNTEAVKSIIDTEIDIIDSQLKNYKVKIDAIFLRALFDDTYFITGGTANEVLGANKYTGKLEAYSPDVELRYEKQIAKIEASKHIVDKDAALGRLLTGSVFKYPSPSADESCAMTFLTRRQLAERIANMNNLTRQQREVLLDDFINTSFGVIKMSPNNTIKHRLAGMDTDFDGVAIVFEKALVNMTLEQREFTTIKSV